MKKGSGLDSPFMKSSTKRQPGLSTRETNCETISEESDGNCGYDPDSESDEGQFTRDLKSDCFESPEILRELVVQADVPVPTLLLAKGKRSISVRNLEQLLGEDKESVQLSEEDTESVQDLASLLITGRKSKAKRRLEFVPIISSVNKHDDKDTVSFIDILSPGSSPKTVGLEKVGEGLGLRGFEKNVSPGRKVKKGRGNFKLSLKKRKRQTDAGENLKTKQTSSSTVKDSDSGEANGFLEARSFVVVPHTQSQRGEFPEKESDENSDEILFGTPQNHNILTLNRKKRSADKLSKASGRGQVVLSKEGSEMKEFKSGNDIGGEEGYDDDLIIIESQDSSPLNVGTTRKSNRKIQENINVASANDYVKLCEYPVGKSDTVTVSIQDYVTLEHDTFLNDIIIDFYLTYLAYNILPIEDRSTVHIFSTMFYKRLMQSPKKNAKKLAFYETDPTLTSAEKRHFRVAGWTKSVDLFGKDLLVVPICEHSHWYLLLVVKPGLITSSVRSEERTLKGEPFIIVLDSMGGTKDSAVRNIRQYLACEWKKKKCTGGDAADEFSFSAAEMKTVRPRKPEQENFSDCGIYLLHYVEKVFHSVAQFFWPSLPDLSDWFTIEEVGMKRGEIADLIKCLVTEQKRGEVINYPNINFSAPRKPRKRQKPVVDSSEEEEEEAEVRSKGKFASAFYSRRERVSNSKQTRNARHRSKTSPNAQEESTGLLNSTKDCEISNVVCVSPRNRKKPVNSNGIKDKFDYVVPVIKEVAVESDVTKQVSYKKTDGSPVVGEEKREKKRRHELDELRPSSCPQSIVSLVNLKSDSGLMFDSRNASKCDNISVPDQKTNVRTDASLIGVGNNFSGNAESNRKKPRKTRDEQILADLEELEKHGIEEEEVTQDSVYEIKRDKVTKVYSGKSALKTPNVQGSLQNASAPGSEMNLIKVIGKTIGQLSPNVKTTQDKVRLHNDTPLYRGCRVVLSPDSIRGQKSERKIPSRSGVESTGDVLTSETSVELINSGLRGSYHTVSCDTGERIKSQTTKMFKLKKVKLARFEDNETQGQKDFDKLMFATSSDGDSDIFSQENN